MMADWLDFKDKKMLLVFIVTLAQYQLNKQVRYKSVQILKIKNGEKSKVWF